jgi:hypothetical protein
LFLPQSTPSNVHQSPSISHLQDLRIPENTSSGPIRFTIGGKPYGRVPPNPYQVTASCSNQTLLPPNDLIIGGSGTNRTITITPASNRFGSSDVTVRVFDGQMTATETFRVDITAVQYPPSNVQLALPLTGSVFTATDTIHLAANAADPDNDLTGVDFLVNGQIIGRDSGNPFIWNWSPPAPGVYRFMAAARDATGNSLTSAPIIAVVQPAANALVPLSAEWRYFSSNAPPANWSAPGFDDSFWPAGFAPIGFGNEQETPLTPDPAQITTFFRHSFLVSNAANFAQLSLRLYSEQGAVVYLNGAEVVRRFLPPGPITFDTLAVISASDGKDRSTVRVILPPAALLSGANTLAVELHRYGSADPILNFDLELAGYTATALPRLAIARAEKNVTLRWPEWSVGYDLEASSSLNASAAWKHLASTPAVLAGEQILTLPATNAVQLFRLHRP